MSGGDGYALNLLTPVRHIATELDRAAPAALSVADLATTYTHSNPGDLARIKQHEGCATDSGATVWLVGHALAALGSQVASDGNGGYLLAKPFDALRYERRKVHRFAETDAKDEERTLRAMYNDLTNDRVFYVTVVGPKGGAQERDFRLHPLARAIPQVTEKAFMDLAADIKHNGVELPIVVYNGRVLDGRHRLAIASALKIPLSVTEVDGDEARAKARVLSLNVTRRHLTSAQRASIVRQLFLPEAKEKAKERIIESGKRRKKDSAEMREPEMSESAKAAEIAVKESGALATVRAVEALSDLDDAPQTQERIDKGQIKTVAEARREARKETGRDPQEKAPVVQPRSAYDRLGCALGDVKAAYDRIESGAKGNVSDEQILARINEIRAHLDRAEGLLR